jgi:hypothetical protein
MKVPFWPVARYRVIVMVWRGWTAKSSGSETARAAGGMTMPASPLLKVTVWRDDGTMALSPDEPFDGRATVIAVMGRSVRPKALDTRMRICDAPVDIWTVCLMVLLKNWLLVVFYGTNGQSKFRLERKASSLTYGGGGRLVYSVN